MPPIIFPISHSFRSGLEAFTWSQTWWWEPDMGVGLGWVGGAYKWLSLCREVTNQRRPCALSAISKLINPTVVWTVLAKPLIWHHTFVTKWLLMTTTQYCFLIYSDLIEYLKAKHPCLPTEHIMMQKVAIKHYVLTLRLYLIYGIKGLSGGLGGFGIFIPEEFWQTKKSHLKLRLLLSHQTTI